MAFDPRQMFNFYQRLSPRERLLLVLAVGSVLLISLYSFVLDPLVGGREMLQRRIVAREKDLAEIQVQRTRYLEMLRQLEASQAVLVRTESGFSLFAYLQNAVAQVVSREHIASMNPTEKNLSDEYQQQSVEIKLTAVSLQQLVDAMYRIEKGDVTLHIARLQVKKRYNDPRSFDITATISLLKPRGAPAAGAAPAPAAAAPAAPAAPPAPPAEKKS
ncbi:MAG TPA: type II secretion system protein GspM [Candidatus Kryptonia bacterium]|nr:type II secretion system protein GspM [Candidatus Kryptonia bacterium]